MVMAKVIIECTDAQAKSIADSFRNEKRKVIINRMLATDSAELLTNTNVTVYNGQLKYMYEGDAYRITIK